MLQKHSSILWRELDGEAVLLSPAEGCSYNLNPVGTFIWKMLDGTHSASAIADAICQDYEVEYAQALQDVENIIADLQQNHLVQESPRAEALTQLDSKQE